MSMKYVNPTVSKQKKPRSGFRGRLTYRDKNGRRRSVTKTFNVRTLSEAKMRLAEWHADMNRRAEEEERSGSTIPVATLVRDHIDRAVATGTIERSTVPGYTGALQNIRKGFGDLPVRDLTREMVEEWEEGMTASGLSSSTVGKAHRLLKMVLNRAVDSDMIPKNPMALVKPPKRKPVHPGINALGKPMRDRVAELLRSMAPCPMAVAATMALHTGMRRGEVCGLRWQDVDLDTGVLWVRRAVGVAKGGTYVKEAKTGRDRDIAITPTLSEVLSAWKAVQPEGCAYVVGGPRGYMNPTLLTKEWMMFVKQYGIIGSEGRPCKFHDLRHTWATAAVAAGIDIKTVSSNLGHANAAMTLNIYASADPEAKRRAAEVMDSVI